MPIGAINPTGERLRAARTMARLEQSDLAARAQVSVETIKRFERTFGQVSANTATMEAVVLPLEAAGIEFTNGLQPGVQGRGWKWYVAILGADDVRRSYQLYPDFESTLAAVKSLKVKLGSPDRPFVHVPAEATEAQRAALKEIELSPIWP